MPGLLTRLGRRALLHNRARVDRFKLASRAHVRERLLADEGIAQAVREHAAEHGNRRARRMGDGRTVHPRDRPVLQRRRVLPDRLSRLRAGC